MEAILEQTPKAGDRVKRGTPVSFKVNLGKIVKFEVPLLEGKTYEASAASITGTPFRIGRIRWIRHNYIERGSVIRQNPAPGTFAAKNFPINLDVSIGSRDADFLLKQETVSFIVPDDLNTSPHKSIKITLKDLRGVNVIYEADHSPGDFIKLMVTSNGTGEVLLFSDGKLKEKVII